MLTATSEFPVKTPMICISNDASYSQTFEGIRESGKKGTLADKNTNPKKLSFGFKVPFPVWAKLKSFNTHYLDDDGRAVWDPIRAGVSCF